MRKKMKNVSKPRCIQKAPAFRLGMNGRIPESTEKAQPFRAGIHRGKKGVIAKTPADIQPKQLEKTIKSIIAEIAEVDGKKIGSGTKFVEDLNMDSMMALEILAAIEKTYKIEIPEESLPKITSLKEVLKLTKELLSKNGRKQSNKK